ncbi:MAG: hypothetical protein K2N37_03000, partial [Lachnospiraceae bacterium]|nr:hypothetical protein [Lachnospiraceae bacterium]
ALIGAAIGAGVEIVSQKVVEKKEEIDWKAVEYEAAVGAISGAIGGFFRKAGGGVLAAARESGKSVAKEAAKRVITAGVSGAVGGFLEDAGRQKFVEGKSKFDVGRLFRTTGIAGLSGMAGAVVGVFKNIFSEYRVETVTKTVTRTKTVNMCHNSRVNCPNHPNHPVAVGTYQQTITVRELVHTGKQGAENAAKSAAAGLDDDVAGIVARKKSPLDQVKDWWKEITDSGGKGSANRYVNGQRKSKYHELTDTEIASLKNDIREIGADENFFRFNEGTQTPYSDKYGVIFVKGDVLPDMNYSSHPRDLMSQKAVLAHEYYGHKYFDDLYGKRNPKVGAWNDEFRASYNAALITPNLEEMDRMYLMLDALERAKDAGVNIKITDTIRRILYGR